MTTLRSLDPRLRPYAEYLLAIGQQAAHDWGGGSLVVTSARRSQAKQAKLYANYLAGKSRIPALPPGRSLHEHGLAWDMARIGVDPLRDPLLVALGELWEFWGGRWGGTRDPVHFQPRI